MWCFFFNVFVFTSLKILKSRWKEEKKGYFYEVSWDEVTFHWKPRSPRCLSWVTLEISLLELGKKCNSLFYHNILRKVICWHFKREYLDKAAFYWTCLTAALQTRFSSSFIDLEFSSWSLFLGVEMKWYIYVWPILHWNVNTKERMHLRLNLGLRLQCNEKG